MTDPTTRDLISRLADELDHYRQLLTDDRREAHVLATEAHAYLAAKPQGDVLTDDAKRSIKEAAEQARQTLEGWANYGNWVWPESALEQAKRNTAEALASLNAALAAEPQGEGEGASAADLLSVDPPDIQTTMALQYRSAWREGVEDAWREARAVLARWSRPAAPPAEALAVRPLLEQVARMGDRIGQHTVGEIMAISDRASAWLRENPPGQPMAIEPRGCPMPGACSCVEPAPPAEGEVAELVAALQSQAIDCTCDQLTSGDLRRAAALLTRQAPQPVPVSERLPEADRKVLAHYVNSHGKGRTICAVWVPAKSRSDSGGEEDFTEYDEETDTFYWPEGWYEVIENWDDLGYVKVYEGEVVYWQPLPTGPALPLPTSGEGQP